MRCKYINNFNKWKPLYVVESNNLVQQVNLLTQYKNVNYLLKIENNDSQVNSEDIVKEIKRIPQVITLYDINKDLKNKENLIFL